MLTQLRNFHDPKGLKSSGDQRHEANNSQPFLYYLRKNEGMSNNQKVCPFFNIKLEFSNDILADGTSRSDTTAGPRGPQERFFFMRRVSVAST